MKPETAAAKTSDREASGGFRRITGSARWSIPIMPASPLPNHVFEGRRQPCRVCCSLVASTFYAVDRYASFKTDGKGFTMTEGSFWLIATPSNMIHQAAKTDPLRDYEPAWHWSLRCSAISVPDCVVFWTCLACSSQLIQNRRNKITGSKAKDIHERTAHTWRNSPCSLAACRKYGWHRFPA